ncbi:Sec20-domain-containing protein [Pseudomassariella vexata]|uniref:Sec20-domain-containing protein n=1 Tax=Pseudomassariella vexata TaxID=1141098 RepID=A0A1Y2DSQ1_9PEZI|nr:Sec20-domain-containing protein [Pseudomassariella vexata]ORY62287.1 Sec20-domain-containing protein [Pseudomassariella vexata]
MTSEVLEQRFADLHDRLTTLQDATSQLKELIDRLANFNFQPGSVPLGAGEDDNVGSELSDEINQILREQEEELELLMDEAVDIPPGRDDLQHDKTRLTDGAQRLKGELQRCRVSFRKAQITAKRNLQLAQKHERELLFASFASPRSGASSPAPSIKSRRRQPLGGSEMSKEDQTLSASSDVTQALRRTHDMMASELSRSQFARQTLQESTAALTQLSETYSSLDSMLSSSRELLGTLMKSQKSDTWYLQSSFYLLGATISWLVFRRFVYGPMWWLVWLPLKLVFRGAVGVSKGVGLHGDGGSLDLGLESPGVRPGVQSVEMNNEGVHTIRGGEEELRRSRETADPESMTEQVGQMIDDATDAKAASEEPPKSELEETLDANMKDETVLRESEDDEQPNPVKRVLEEEIHVDTVPENEIARDEL